MTLVTDASLVTVLAGGVGAARFLAGLVQEHPPRRVYVVGNTADDVVSHGLHVSPDLDTVTYTLAGAINPDTGWGLAGETWSAMAMLEHYGGQAWFRLGDRDLGTHLYRTTRLSEGADLATVTAEIAEAWDIGVRLVPVTNDRLQTRVTVAGEGEIGFQEYFVEPLRGPADRLLRELGHEPSVVGVARLYAPLVATLVIDEADAAEAAAVEAEGLR